MLVGAKATKQRVALWQQLVDTILLLTDRKPPESGRPAVREREDIPL